MKPDWSEATDIHTTNVEVVVHDISDIPASPPAKTPWGRVLTRAVIVTAWIAVACVLGQMAWEWING